MTITNELIYYFIDEKVSNCHWMYIMCITLHRRQSFQHTYQILQHYLSLSLTQSPKSEL